MPLVRTMSSRQGGVALFLCLVVLLVLGVAGTSASQTVSLEARMARNGHDGELALYAAESALREGERLLVSAGFDPDMPGLHEGTAFGAPKPWTLSEIWRDTGVAWRRRWRVWRRRRDSSSNGSLRGRSSALWKCSG